MTDQQISAMTAGTPTATDTFPFQRGGMANYQASGSALGAGTILLPYVAPGTSGNVLTSNGTAWTSADRTPNTNILIDGGFTINQRVYVSAAALSAGSYAHDGWKAGAGGGDYSFTQLASPTQITIAANKTVIQVVPANNVDGGTYTLSWEGTCQGRVTINSATPSGAYADSPITVTGQTAGTTMSVEFGKGASSGTLGKVKLEPGSVATPFVSRLFAEELRICQAYFEKSYAYSTAIASAVSSPTIFLQGDASSGFHTGQVSFKVEKAADPTIVLYDITGNVGKITTYDAAATPTSNVSPTSAPATGTASTQNTSNFRVAHNANVAGIGFYWTAKVEL
jgi:hypothetical protein